MPLIKQAIGYYVGDRVGGFPGVLPGMQSYDVRQLWVAG